MAQERGVVDINNRQWFRIFPNNIPDLIRKRFKGAAQVPREIHSKKGNTNLFMFSVPTSSFKKNIYVLLDKSLRKRIREQLSEANISMSKVHYESSNWEESSKWCAAIEDAVNDGVEHKVFNVDYFSYICYDESIGCRIWVETTKDGTKVLKVFMTNNYTLWAEYPSVEELIKALKRNQNIPFGTRENANPWPVFPALLNTLSSVNY